jgi:tetratricopeptide (TPR) repeat protein
MDFWGKIELIKELEWALKPFFKVFFAISIYFLVYRLHLYTYVKWKWTKKIKMFISDEKVNKILKNPHAVAGIVVFLYLAGSIGYSFNRLSHEIEYQRKSLSEEYRKISEIKAKLYVIVGSSFTKPQAEKEIAKAEEYLKELYYYLVDYPRAVLSVREAKKYLRWRDKNFGKLMNFDFPNKHSVCFQKYEKLRDLRKQLGNVPAIKIRLENLAKSRDCRDSFLVHFTLSEVLKQLGKKERDRDYILQALEEMKKSLSIAYDKGLKDKKEIVPLLHSYAECNLLLGKIEEAEMYLRKTLELYPYHPKANSQLMEIRELKEVLKITDALDRIRKDIESVNNLIRNDDLITSVNSTGAR